MIDITKIKTAEQKTIELEQMRVQEIKEQRKNAYMNEADPLFFKAQRGEINLEEWLSKIQKIKEKFPY